MHIKLPYSEQSGHIPSADRLKVGELWINGADNIIGTKKQNEQVVQFAQLTPEQRERVLNDYIPKHGVVDKVSVGQTATKIEGKNDAVTIDINDDSDTAIEYTVTNSALTINVEKTTGHKATKLVISKPASQPVVITWNGVDHWLSTAGVPAFGESVELEELCVAIFTSSTINCVNVIYNTEEVGSSDDVAVWGTIGGTLSDQEDLQAALNSKLSVNVAAETYLKKTDKAERAKVADTVAGANVSGVVAEATKATQDGTGKVIATTYATKTEVTQGLEGKEDKGVCLPLTGGILKGGLWLDDFIRSTGLRTFWDIGGGSSITTGGQLTLYTINDGTYPGGLTLSSTDGTNVHRLCLFDDGRLELDGHSVERVNTSDRNYIRFESGLQICWGTANTESNRFATVTFEVPFIYNPYISALVGGDTDTIYSPMLRTCTPTGITLLATNPSGNQVGAGMDWIAIGRWK